MSDGFKGSPEYEDWVESGERDEEESYYRDKYNRRIRLEQSK